MSLTNNNKNKINDRYVKRGDFTKLNIPAGDQGAQFDSVENTPDGAVLYLTDDQIASSWVVSLPVSCNGDEKRV